MSLSTLPYNDRRVEYEASAGQTDFWFDFPLARALDLSVTRRRGGELSALSQPRDYQLVQFGQSGGTVRLTVGAQVGDVLELFGERKIERTTNFSQRGDFSADAINDEFNYIYMILQELKEEHGEMVQLPSVDAVSAAGLRILAQDVQGRTVTLDASAFVGEQGLQGVRGEKGKPGDLGPRGSVPSVIAEAQSGCVVANIDSGFFGDDVPCSDAAVFSLTDAPEQGVLGWNAGGFQIFAPDEFIGPVGPRGVVPSVIAEADNGAYIGNIDGGYFGQGGGNISGNIFSLQPAPGVMGFDENGEAKLFGYGEFKGDQGAAGLLGLAGSTGPVGPVGPAGVVPSVIAEADNGAYIGNIDGGYFGQGDGNISGNIFSLQPAPGVMGFDENGEAKLFGYGEFKGDQGAAGLPGPPGLPGTASAMRADNIYYNSGTVKTALDTLNVEKSDRNDPVDAGLFGQNSDELDAGHNSDEWLDANTEPTQVQNETIDGGLF